MLWPPTGTCAFPDGNGEELVGYRDEGLARREEVERTRSEVKWSEPRGKLLNASMPILYQLPRHPFTRRPDGVARTARPRTASNRDRPCCSFSGGGRRE